MKDDRIEKRLQKLNGYLLRLKKYSRIDLNTFVHDETIISATERILQLAIETCLNIGNRIISIEQFDRQIKIPENYSEIFQKLAHMNIISDNKLNSFINMTKFRNRLVHMYWDIDSNLLYSYLQENISDFDYYASIIVKYLNDNKND